METFGHFRTSLEKALNEIDPKWKDYKGIIGCGSHTPKSMSIDRIVSRIKEARESDIPTLLICMGHQFGAIEYARNVLGIKDATSEEFGIPGTFVVKKRPEMKVGYHDGESWWSSYEVVCEYNPPEHFISVPFHPEYQSTKMMPHPLLVRFIQNCKNYKGMLNYNNEIKGETISKGAQNKSREN